MFELEGEFGPTPDGCLLICILGSSWSSAVGLSKYSSRFRVVAKVLCDWLPICRTPEMKDGRTLVRKLGIQKPHIEKVSVRINLDVFFVREAPDVRLKHWSFWSLRLEAQEIRSPSSLASLGNSSPPLNPGNRCFVGGCASATVLIC